MNRVSSNKYKWYSPKKGSWKSNTDGTMDLLDGWCGLGILIRDHQGRIMASVVKKLRASGDVLFTELQAIIFGLEVAIWD
ncbi:hypothetical protein TorRG33x02_169300, partial [Trema orientale]